MWSHNRSTDGVNTEQLGRWRCLSSPVPVFIYDISVKAVIHKGRKRPKVSGYQDLRISTRVWRLLVIHKDKGKEGKGQVNVTGSNSKKSGISMEGLPKTASEQNSLFTYTKAAMHNAAFTRPHGMFRPWWVLDQQQPSRLPLEAQNAVREGSSMQMYMRKWGHLGWSEQ